MILKLKKSTCPISVPRIIVYIYRYTCKLYIYIVEEYVVNVIYNNENDHGNGTRQGSILSILYSVYIYIYIYIYINDILIPFQQLYEIGCKIV